MRGSRRIRPPPDHTVRPKKIVPSVCAPHHPNNWAEIHKWIFSSSCLPAVRTAIPHINRLYDSLSPSSHGVRRASPARGVPSPSGSSDDPFSAKRGSVADFVYASRPLFPVIGGDIRIHVRTREPAKRQQVPSELKAQILDLAFSSAIVFVVEVFDRKSVSVFTWPLFGL